MGWKLHQSPRPHEQALVCRLASFQLTMQENQKMRGKIVETQVGVLCKCGFALWLSVPKYRTK